VIHSKNPKCSVSRKKKIHLHCEARTGWVNPCHLIVENMLSFTPRIQNVVFQKKEENTSTMRPAPAGLTHATSELKTCCDVTPRIQILVFQKKEKNTSTVGPAPAGLTHATSKLKTCCDITPRIQNLVFPKKEKFTSTLRPHRLG
jgi:hypothetical protein